MNTSTPYIDGARVDPVTPRTFDVINPATEAVASRTHFAGFCSDVDRAVKHAARRLSDLFANHADQRAGALLSAHSSPNTRSATPITAAAITDDLGAPGRTGAEGAVAAVRPCASADCSCRRRKHYHFEEQRGSTLIRKEPIGVLRPDHAVELASEPDCLVRQAPALATGCTMVVLKPSEIAPASAQVWTEILHAAGVPAGCSIWSTATG